MGELPPHGEELRVAAVDVAPGSLELRAQVLAAGPAERASPARGSDPRHAHPIPRPETPGPWPRFLHPSDHLVTEDYGQPRRRPAPLRFGHFAVADDPARG